MNKKITIIDYELGNLASVANALEKLEIPYEISGDLKAIKKAKALILPGVGAARECMKNLKRKGLDKVIVEAAKKGTPILGICLGMQLFFTSSDEGNVECLGLIKGKVKKLNTKLKIPEIGWNTTKIMNQKARIMKNIINSNYFYFVNSYICVPDDISVVAATTDYDGEFCSVLEKKNIFGVQFHPEKSSNSGLQILNNFWEVICK